MEWTKTICGDYRKESKPNLRTIFYSKCFIDLEKTDVTTIEDLKSGDHNRVFGISGLSEETLNSEINDWISKYNKLKVIVLPPTKEGKPNQMKWLAERIKVANPSVIVLEFKSDYYKLHSFDNYEARYDTIMNAYKSWKPMDDKEFAKLNGKASNEIQYLFLDDVLTAGMTGLAVASKVNEIVKNVDFTVNDSGSNWSKNFKFLCLAKIK